MVDKNLSVLLNSEKNTNSNQIPTVTAEMVALCLLLREILKFLIVTVLQTRRLWSVDVCTCWFLPVLVLLEIFQFQSEGLCVFNLLHSVCFADHSLSCRQSCLFLSASAEENRQHIWKHLSL